MKFRTTNSTMSDFKHVFVFVGVDIKILYSCSDLSFWAKPDGVDGCASIYNYRE